MSNDLSQMLRGLLFDYKNVRAIGSMPSSEEAALRNIASALPDVIGDIAALEEENAALRLLVEGKDGLLDEIRGMQPRIAELEKERDWFRKGYDESNWTRKEKLEERDARIAELEAALRKTQSTISSLAGTLADLQAEVDGALKNEGGE